MPGQAAFGLRATVQVVVGVTDGRIWNVGRLMCKRRVCGTAVVGIVDCGGGNGGDRRGVSRCGQCRAPGARRRAGDATRHDHRRMVGGGGGDQVAGDRWKVGGGSGARVGHDRFDQWHGSARCRAGRLTAARREGEFAHLPNDRGCIVRLLPLGLGEVLAQLFRHRAVDVGVASRVAADPRMLERLSTREPLVRVDADQMSNEVFGRVRYLVPVRRVELEIACKSSRNHNYNGETNGMDEMGSTMPNRTYLSVFEQTNLCRFRRRTAGIRKAKCMQSLLCSIERTIQMCD